MADAMEKIEKYLADNPPINAPDTRLLRDVAYDQLSDAIRHADLQPGDPLSENRLSRALGISRTPVREALQQLAQEGIVQIIPGRAITVAAPSIQEVLEGVHIRELLEPELYRLAAETMPQEARNSLQDAMEKMEQATKECDRSSWSRADTVYHEIVSNVCPNRLLGQLVLQARNRGHSTAIDEQTTDERISECTVEHRQIVDAILSRNADKAERLARDHIRQLRRSLFKRLIRY